MKFTRPDITLFRKIIFNWWATHKRDLPWRHTNDPYKILVSEIMLQQTQVDRVLPKYKEFIEVYPDVSGLSDASVSDVLRLWKGLGYNRRALYLKKAADYVVKTYGGVFPETEVRLRELPGVGLYTARAILVFAYKKNTAMVDTNVRRIIEHFFFDDTNQTSGAIQKAADILVPAGKSWEWHQALMDYGSLELKHVHKKNKTAKTKLPFKETSRFIRGKIIDELRKSDLPSDSLIRMVSLTCNRSEEEVQLQLNRLASEGLCVISGDGSVRLPL